MSGHNHRFNFPSIYPQELIASKYNLASFNQSPYPGAETQPWVEFGDFNFIFDFCFVLFFYCSQGFFGGKSVLFCLFALQTEKL